LLLVRKNRSEVLILRPVGAVKTLKMRVVAYFDFLCDPAAMSSVLPLRFNAANVRKTAEDTEDFAEKAEKKSNWSPAKKCKVGRYPARAVQISGWSLAGC
jgi:hypothetical protein